MLFTIGNSKCFPWSYFSLSQHSHYTQSLLEGIATCVVKRILMLHKALPNYETCPHGKILLTHMWLVEVQQWLAEVQQWLAGSVEDWCLVCLG